MPKFNIQLSATAVMSQSRVIEANTEEEARALAMDGIGRDSYNNHSWEYEGVEDDTVRVEGVEVVI